jgi:hypothetical protein
VKLSLDHPAESVLATYVVFGRSPRWVYRLEDFNMIMHWDHPMGGENGAAPKSQTAIPPSGNAGTPASNESK